MIKKILIVLCVALCVFAVCYNAYQSEKRTEGKQVVYALLPLTGTVAEIGKDAQKYIQIWEKLNPDAPFRVEFVDSESKPDRAVSALNQVLFKAHDPIVISLFSFISKATIPIVEKTNGFVFAPIMIMSMGEGYTHYQRICSSILDSLSPLVNYVRPDESVGIINLDDEYGVLNAKWFKNEIVKKGIHLAAHETLGFRDLDVRIPVYKVLDAKPDIIYVTGTASMAYSNILKELAAQEFKGTVLVDYAFENRNNIKNVGNINLDIIATVISMEKFIANYPQAVSEIKNSNAEIYYITAQIFDTLDLIKYTLENNLTFTQDTYAKIGKWKGVTGDVLFPGNGDSLYPFVLVRYKNGQFVPVEESEGN